MQFKVYFELFGKKMVTTVEASNEKEAQEKVRSKIIFHKTQDVFWDDMDKQFEQLMNVLGAKKKNNA